MSIDEQAEDVLTRLQPVAGQIQSLTASGKVAATLQLVRYFNDEDAPPAPQVELAGENGTEVGPQPNYLLGSIYPSSGCSSWSTSALTSTATSTRTDDEWPSSA